ncbi:MAG: sodium/glutamate symporter [Clostridia bacterium]|nr:sodium/glutamate symporter [Clostridia bacterium]
MTTGFDFWDPQVWSVFGTFAALLIAMLAANFLRRAIRPLRKALIPSPVLGGFLLLAFCGAYKAITKTDLLPAASLEIITYHGLGLGFVAVSLKSAVKQKSRRARRDIFNSALVTTTTYILQALVGLALSFGLSFLIGSWPAAGMLLPMGYGQGPGQAYNWGHTYEASNGFTNGTSFGLTVAALGFVAASIGGVAYLWTLRRKGNAKILEKLAKAEALEEDVAPEELVDKNEIPISDSIDKLTVQFALVFLSYAIAYAVLALLSKLCDLSGVNLLITTVKPLLWGFNFIFGTLAAILVRTVLNALFARGVMKKRHLNNFMLDRVSGVMFDLMVVAAIGAINLSAFQEREFVVPLLVLCVAAGIASYFYVRHTCSKLFPGYADESFLAMYGMLTGTASTGVILLRELDPEYETPACKNLIYQALWTCLLGFPLLLLMGFVARSTAWLIITFGILAIMFCFFYLLIRRAARVNAQEDEA